MIKLIPCPFCPYKTKYKHNLNRHIRMHTGERPFKCPQCQKSFTTSFSLNRHEVVHTQEKKFKCSECNKKFTRKDHLDKHKRIHLDDWPFKCGDCHYAAKTKAQLNNHLKVHLGGVEKEKIKGHKCPHCPYKCSRSDSMKRHLRTHTGEKPFPCPHCPHKTTSSSDLKVHIARSHTVKKKFKREFCDYSTVASSQLNGHMRTHTGEKPYKCSFDGCKYSAAVSSYVKRHEMVHRGEKKFKCAFCDFSSVTNTNLNDHMRTHTGEKLYRCPHCDYSATQNSHLKRHKQRIHKRQFRHMNNSVNTTKRIWGCKVRDCPFQTSKQKQLALHLNGQHKLPLISIERIRNYSSSRRQSTKTHEKIIRKEKISESFSCSTKLNFKIDKIRFDIPAKSHQKRDKRRPSHITSRIPEAHEKSDPGRISVSYQTGKDAEVRDFNRLTISRCIVRECQFRGFEAKKLALHLNREHQLPHVQLPKFNLIFI